MRTLAFAAMIIGTWGLVACGGGGDKAPDADIILPPDAAADVDAPPVGGDCNPVENTGCEAGEKCTQIIDQEEPDFLARVACVADGTVPKDGMCEFGDVAAGEGYDNCVGGLFCRNGLCTEICSVNPDSCPADHACSRYTETFDNDDNIGLCDPTCNPLDLGSCMSEDLACYLNIFTDSASCAGVAGEVQQNQACMFLNSCSPGLSCSLIDPTQTELWCAHMCDPMTGMTAQGILCSQVPEIAAGTPTCAQINMFYSDVETPDTLGMCIDCAIPEYSMLAVCTP